jgi:hypothetical protein
MQKWKRIDLIVMILWPIVASVITILFEKSGLIHENFFISVVIFLTLPAIYLSIKKLEIVPKTLLTSLIASIPITIIVEYLGYISEAWSLPATVFPFKIFGVVIFEMLFWSFWSIYFVIVFHEYFWDEQKGEKLVSDRFKFFTFAVLVIFILFLFVIFNITVPPIPYFYLIFGLILFGLPTLLQLISYHKNRRLNIKY